MLEYEVLIGDFAFQEKVKIEHIEHAVQASFQVQQGLLLVALFLCLGFLRVLLWFDVVLSWFFLLLLLCFC